MCFPYCHLFLSTRPYIDSMRATVITDPVIDYRRIVHDDGIIYINIMNNGTIHMNYSRIVSERISLPSAAAESGAIVTVSVVHASIETNMGCPVSMMKTIITS